MCKKKLFIVTTMLFLAMSIFAQKEEQLPKEPIVKFSGHFNYEAYFDNYASYTSREGDIYLFPKRQVLNSKNEDINAYNQLNMLAAQSRLRAKINGPEALGAKVDGLVEIDFLGKAAMTAKGEAVELTQTPRIRHLFFNLSWDKTQLTFGQTWHPLFATECFPDVLAMGGALPFNPTNRSPQARITYSLTEKIKIVGAASSYLDFVSSGPIDAQLNAVLPDLHGQVKFKSGGFDAGIIGGYKLLKPRITLPSDSSFTEQTIGSFDIAAFAKVKANSFTVKVYGIYGQNLSPYAMIGGFGAAADPNLVEDYSYSNINTMSVWTELMYQINAIELGFFAGYSANLSSSTENFYKTVSFARGGTVDNLVRISPRLTYTSGRVMLGLEYMLTTATYMDLADDKYEAISTDDAVANDRIYFSARYTF